MGISVGIEKVDKEIPAAVHVLGSSPCLPEVPLQREFLYQPSQSPQIYLSWEHFLSLFGPQPLLPSLCFSLYCLSPSQQLASLSYYLSRAYPLSRAYLFLLSPSPLLHPPSLPS